MTHKMKSFTILEMLTEINLVIFMQISTLSFDFELYLPCVVFSAIIRTSGNDYQQLSHFQRRQLKPAKVDPGHTAGCT